MFAGSQQPLTPYHPEERGIKVIQKYVTAVSGDQGCTERSAQKGGVYDYDFIGAVGLRKGKARKAAVFYHVYWTGFGPKDMTWEPEHHIFREDLEMLWSKYGRVNRAGSIHVRVGRDVPIRTTVSPVDMSCVKYLSPVASPGTRQEDSPPTLTMANTCVPDALDGLESSAEGERKLDWTQENAGFPPERRSFSCSQNVLATATIDLLQSEQMHEDFHPMDEEAPLQQSDLHETNSKLSETRTSGINIPDDPETNPVDFRSTPSEDEMVSPNNPKRKRKFYRRTKTGCLSCRERRKKCDEQKPSCKNCIRLRQMCKGYIPARRQDVRDLRSVAENSFTWSQMPLANPSPKSSSFSMLSESPFQRYPVVDDSQNSAWYMKGHESLPHLAELNLPTALLQYSHESNLTTSFLLDGIKVGFRSANSVPNLRSAQPIEPTIMTMTGVHLRGLRDKLTGPFLGKSSGAGHLARH